MRPLLSATYLGNNLYLSSTYLDDGSKVPTRSSLSGSALLSFQFSQPSSATIAPCLIPFLLSRRELTFTQLVLDCGRSTLDSRMTQWKQKKAAGSKLSAITTSKLKAASTPCVIQACWDRPQDPRAALRANL